MEGVSRQPTETIRLWLPVRGLGGGSRPFVEVESLVCLSIVNSPFSPCNRHAVFWLANMPGSSGEPPRRRLLARRVLRHDQPAGQDPRVERASNATTYRLHVGPTTRAASVVSTIRHEGVRGSEPDLDGSV